jgi:hypothetical protein
MKRVSILIGAVLLIAVSYAACRPVAYVPATAAILPFGQLPDSSGLLRRLAIRAITLFHQPRTVRVQTELWTGTNVTVVSAAKALGRAPATEEDGTALWFISIGDMPRLDAIVGGPVATNDQKVAAAPLARPSLVVSEFGSGSVFAGRSVSIDGSSIPVGVQLGIAPRLVNNRIRLDLSFLCSEAVTNAGNPAAVEIRTNAAFNARIEANKGARVFLVSRRRSDQPAACLYISGVRSQ